MKFDGLRLRSQTYPNTSNSQQGNLSCYWSLILILLYFGPFWLLLEYLMTSFKTNGFLKHHSLLLVNHWFWINFIFEYLKLLSLLTVYLLIVMIVGYLIFLFNLKLSNLFHEGLAVNFTIVKLVFVLEFLNG